MREPAKHAGDETHQGSGEQCRELPRRRRRQPNSPGSVLGSGTTTHTMIIIRPANQSPTMSSGRSYRPDIAHHDRQDLGLGG